MSEHTALKHVMAKVRERMDTSETAPREITEQSQLLYRHLHGVGCERRECWKAAERYRRSRDSQRRNMLYMLGIGGVDELRSLADTELQES